MSSEPLYLALKYTISFFATSLILWGCGNDNGNSTTQPSIQDDKSSNISQPNQQISCTEGEVITDFSAIDSNYICSKGQWININRISQMAFCDMGTIQFNGQSWQICINGDWYESQEPITGCPKGEIRNYIYNNSMDAIDYANHDLNGGFEYICINNMWIHIRTAISAFPDKESFINLSFSYGTMTDPRDGKIYRTTTIGNQIWMAENLAYDDSSYVYPSCCLLYPGLVTDNLTRACNVSGRLYSWDDAMGNRSDLFFSEQHHQGICPEGWHIPSESEFQNLLSIEASKLITSVGWISASRCTEGTDEYGFSALPVGTYIPFGNSHYEGQSTYASFWSDKELNTNRAHCFVIGAQSEMGTWWCGSMYTDASKDNARSVRCVKD